MVTGMVGGYAVCCARGKSNLYRNCSYFGLTANPSPWSRSLWYRFTTALPEECASHATFAARLGPINHHWIACRSKFAPLISGDSSLLENPGR